METNNKSTPDIPAEVIEQWEKIAENKFPYSVEYNPPHNIVAKWQQEGYAECLKDQYLSSLSTVSKGTAEDIQRILDETVKDGVIKDWQHFLRAFRQLAICEPDVTNAVTKAMETWRTTATQVPQDKKNLLDDILVDYTFFFVEQSDKAGAYENWKKTPSARSLLSQLWATPRWVKDFTSVSFERAAGRHQKAGKYAYFTILKVRDNLFNIEGDHLYPASELQEVGIEWLDESTQPAQPEGNWDELERRVKAEIPALEKYIAENPSYSSHSRSALKCYNQVLAWIGELRGQSTVQPAEDKTADEVLTFLFGTKTDKAIFDYHEVITAMKAYRNQSSTSPKKDLTK
jgi:hypothetical protein